MDIINFYFKIQRYRARARTELKARVPADDSELLVVEVVVDVVVVVVVLAVVVEVVVVEVVVDFFRHSVRSKVVFSF